MSFREYVPKFDNVNDEFRSLFNDLEDYLKEITGLNPYKDSLIWYLEDAVPGSWSRRLKTIRKERNKVHGNYPDGAMPDARPEWNKFLKELKEEVEKNKGEIVQKLHKIYNERKNKDNKRSSSTQTNYTNKGQGTTKPANVNNGQGEQTQPNTSNKGNGTANTVNAKKVQANQTAKPNPKAELENYKKSKIAIIQKRIDNFETEFVDNSIPHAIRDKLKESANSYLVSMQNAATKDEADGRFDAYQRAFGDLKQHRIYLDWQKEKKESSAIKNKPAKKAPAKKSGNSVVVQNNSNGYNNVVVNNVTYVQADPQTVTNNPAPKSNARLSYYNSRSRGRLLAWLIPLIVVLVLAAGITCMCVFGNWTMWQYVIGAGGGLLLVGLGIGAYFLFNDVLDFEGYLVQILLEAIIIIVNFVLVCIYVMQYNIIFIWLASLTVLSGVALTVAAFANDDDFGWKVAGIASIILSALLFAVGLLVLYGNWKVWQVLIGTGVGFGVFAITMVLCCITINKDEESVDIGVFIGIFVLLVVVAITNGVLFGKYVSQYRVIFTSVSVGAIASSVVATVFAFIRGADWTEYGFIPPIVFIALSVALGLEFGLAYAFIK